MRSVRTTAGILAARRRLRPVISRSECTLLSDKKIEQMHNTPKLSEWVGKQVTVKPTGLSKAVNCQLVGLQEEGIWIASQELTEQVRNSSGQVVLPHGYPKVFVPYARLDWLVLSTED